MEWLLVFLVGGGGLVAVRRLRSRLAVQRDDLTELEGVRRLADEDVTLLGEQLQRVDAEVTRLDEPARLDYQRALDAYESAQRAVPLITSAAEISRITDTLSTGRYALACVQARAAGSPVPEHRVPCFFNPAHGPSTCNVVWTPPGHGTRTVPACAQDAARIANDERPEVRTVTIGSRRVPYWQAGAAFLPYGKGYFPTDLPAAGAMMAWAFDPVVDTTHGAWDAGGSSGDLGGGFMGGFDGGGFDAGGDGGG